MSASHTPVIRAFFVFSHFVTAYLVWDCPPYKIQWKNEWKNERGGADCPHTKRWTNRRPLIKLSVRFLLNRPPWLALLPFFVIFPLFSEKKSRFVWVNSMTWYAILLYRRLQNGRVVRGETIRARVVHVFGWHWRKWQKKKSPVRSHISGRGNLAMIASQRCSPDGCMDIDKLKASGVQCSLDDEIDELPPRFFFYFFIFL